MLAGAQTLDDEGADLVSVAAILRAGGERENTTEEFAEAISRLQEALGTRPWLASLLTDLAPRALCWNNRDLFAAEAERLPVAW